MWEEVKQVEANSALLYDSNRFTYSLEEDCVIAPLK